MCESNTRLDRPSDRWQQALVAGTLQQDAAQEVWLPLLDQVVTALSTPVQRVPWRGVEVWRGEEANVLPACHGVYLYGDVGRGKSMLMQTLFDCIPITAKRRVHFHPFMEELHQRLHHAKPPKTVDLILYMASLLSEEARLLCFDEFYITNIADGMLLGRLLDALFQCGVTLCATSNWAPDELFQDGINRGSVLPFIALLKKRVHLCALSDGVDWRCQLPAHTQYQQLPVETLFTQLTGTLPQPVPILLKQATVTAHGLANGVIWFEFETLCSSMLGRAEYMALCSQVNRVIISGLPQLSDERVDSALRFVVLVDILYEYQISLQIYSHVALEEVYPEGVIACAWRRAVSRVHALGRIEGICQA